jgi:hypothetical protein
MPHVFISYAKVDTRPLAEELFSLINEMEGFSAWMDSSLEPASSWANQIQREIQKADLVLVLLSPDVNREESEHQRRSFVMNEIDFAQQVHKRILPVMAQPTFVPVQIAGLEYIDLTKNKEQGLKRLISSIQRSHSKKEAVVSEAKPLTTKKPQFSLPLVAGFVGILTVLLIGGFFLWPYLSGTQGNQGREGANEPSQTESPTNEATATDTATDEATNTPTIRATQTNAPTATDRPNNEPTSTSETPTTIILRYSGSGGAYIRNTPAGTTVIATLHTGEEVTVLGYIEITPPNDDPMFWYYVEYRPNQNLIRGWILAHIAGLRAYDSGTFTEIWDALPLLPEFDAQARPVATEEG